MLSFLLQRARTYPFRCWLIFCTLPRSKCFRFYVVEISLWPAEPRGDLLEGVDTNPLTRCSHRMPQSGNSIQSTVLRKKETRCVCSAIRRWPILRCLRTKVSEWRCSERYKIKRETYSEAFKTNQLTKMVSSLLLLLKGNTTACESHTQLSAFCLAQHQQQLSGVAWEMNSLLSLCSSLASSALFSVFRLTILTCTGKADNDPKITWNNI